jgi:hypothetical protein
MSRDMRPIVRARITKLQALDDASLRTLPSLVEEIEESNPVITIFQYHDQSPNGEHTFVIQASRKRWLGMFTATEVDGFVITTDGSRRGLTESEKWPFI